MTNTWNPLEIIAEQEADKARVTALLRQAGVVGGAPAAPAYVGRHRRNETQLVGVDSEGLTVYRGTAF